MSFSMVVSFLMTFSFNAFAATPILDVNAIDKRVNPCENFYQYACGQWLEQTKLPAHKAVIYRQSEELENQSWVELKNIIEKSEPTSSLHRFYSACMSEPRDMPESLTKILRQIEKIQNTDDLAFVTGQLHALNVNALFGFTTWQDLDRPTRTIAFLTQGGMALPEKDYYLKTDAEAKELRQKYQKHIANVLRLAQIEKGSSAETAAKKIYAIEKSLAEKSLALEDQWTPSIIKNKISFARLKSRYGEWNWDFYFSGLGLKHRPREFNLNEPLFYKRLNQLVRDGSISDLKKYLMWQTLHKAAPWLTSDLAQENFAFWKQELEGIDQQEPQWQRCVELTGDSVRDLLGKSYVESLPNAEATKHAINQIIDQALKVFSDSLGSITWIDNETAQGAQEKLSHFGRKVGYPETWDSYQQLSVSDKDRTLNLFAAAKYSRTKEFVRIDKDVVNNEWTMSPWEVNAYYDPSLNEFAFPFGILRPPAFDLEANDAINMGVFGALVGHEMLHAFDADGSQYDYQGRAIDWWSSKSREQFESRSQCLIKQANTYEILPGLFVNGERTITENVADQGGLKMAYAMYLQRKKQNGEAPRLGDLSGDQQFFVAFAQSWCVKRTDESMRVLINSNTHPPEEFRVNASIMNRPEFAEVFACQLGQPMVPTHRCDMW